MIDIDIRGGKNDGAQYLALVTASTKRTDGENGLLLS